MEAGDGKGIAQPLDGPGQQRHRFLRELQEGLVARGRLLVERLRKIEQQQHGDVAARGLVAHVDARIGRGTALEFDQGTQRDVEVEFGAFLLVADAYLVLWLQQVEQALQTLGQRFVLGQQAVDLCGVPGRVQRFVEAHPVGAVGLALVIPLRVVARRQAVDFRALQLARFVEGFFLVAFLDEFPELSVVVPIADHGIVEEDFGQLVALPARAGNVGERQFGHGGRALADAGMEAGHKLLQHSIAVTVVGIKEGTREHGQAMAQAGGRVGIAGAFDGLGMEGEEDAREAGILAHQQRIDTRVLEKLDCHALEGAPVVGDLRRRPAAVADHVGQHGAVAIKPGYPVGIVIHVRHTHTQLVVIKYRLADLANRQWGRRVGHQHFRVVPQCAEVKVEPALDVVEERAVAFALQDGAAVG